MTDRLCLARCVGLVSLLLAATVVSALDVPPLRGRVNDYGGLMSVEQSRRMESQLAQFETETGHQVAVLTVPSLDGEDIERFSIRVAERWKIGKKGFDNGVILVISVKDRRLRLEVGYGLEGVLPDAIAIRIIRDHIVPHFRSQDYGAGIIAGVDAVLKMIKNEPLPASARRQARPPSSNLNFIAMLAVTLAVLGLMGFASAAKRRRSSLWAGHGRRHPPIYWGGGGFGGGASYGGGGFSGGGGGFGGGGASSSW